MFSTLQEAIDPNFLRLTSTQQAVLLLVFVAQTPELAYAELVGTVYTTTAAEFLIRAGLVQSGGGQATATSAGFDYLISAGLITAPDVVTDEGNAVIDAYNKELGRIAESLIPFRSLKAIS